MKTIQKSPFWTINVVFAGLLITITAFVGQVPTRPTSITKRDLSQDEVRRLETAMMTIDPNLYRLVLPLYRDGKVAGSKVYGNIPFEKVRLVAKEQNFSLKDRGNLQFINNGPCNPNSHCSTRTKRLDEVIFELKSKLDAVQYTYLRQTRKTI